MSGMASPCYKGIGFQSWSLCCGLNLTVDLKVPFQVCLDITCSDCWFVVRSRAHCEDHQENTELSLAMQWHFFFFVRGASDKLAPSVREMAWRPFKHSFSQSILLISQAPTCFSACSSSLGTGNFVLPVEGCQFPFPARHTCCCFSTQLLLFPENFYPGSPYFAGLLWKPFPSFSGKTGSIAL